MAKLKYKLQEARQGLYQNLTEVSKNTNKLWQSILRLLITLSTSFLLITLAVVDKMFPEIETLPLILIIAWIFLLLTIVLGIISELNEIIFKGNISHSYASRIHKIDRLIASGKTEEEIEMPKEYLIHNDIIFGVLTINFFMLSVLSLCLAFLGKFCSDYTCWVF
ncbi:MAG: hypothetical protein PHQ52_07260 [Candidatus Omnitrophica bacterium]|nr:hypothetical protein [Candidatus Omnitrophota bacterium]